MQIAVLKERWPGETRVAVTPETVGHYRDLGCSVVIEAGAGVGASVSDDAFESAGAVVMRSATAVLKDADIVLKLRAPLSAGRGPDELAAIRKKAVLVALLDPARNPGLPGRLAKAGVTAFAMDLMPRITRAQSADALSSQSNLAGYKAVIDAAALYDRALPMMMTAAGAVSPARVLILGAGVAGLQAIATARRLGAVVSAFDVRPAAREQVESLGAKFIEVEDTASAQAETAGGYAREMSDDYQRRQAQEIATALAGADMVISTALIPGKPAPVLMTEEMVRGMKPGSVIVDLAIEAGGNCAVSQAGRTVVQHGVRVMAPLNPPGRLAADASMLYARNVLAFLKPLIDEGGKLRIDWSDDIVRATCLTRSGRIVHPDFSVAGRRARPASKKPVQKRTAQKKVASKRPPPKKPAPKKPVTKAAAKSTNMTKAKKPAPKKPARTVVRKGR